MISLRISLILYLVHGAMGSLSGSLHHCYYSINGSYHLAQDGAEFREGIHTSVYEVY